MEETLLVIYPLTNNSIISRQNITLVSRHCEEVRKFEQKHKKSVLINILSHTLPSLLTIASTTSSISKPVGCGLGLSVERFIQ